jgi:hypothetical protein
MHRLLGVLGRARADLDERLHISLYDSMVSDTPPVLSDGVGEL